MSNHVVLSSDVTGKLAGTTLVTDTAAHTPGTGHTSWYRFVPLQNTVIATMTVGGMDGNAQTSVTCNVGCILDIPGCTSFTLTSGSGVLYYDL